MIFCVIILIICNFVHSVSDSRLLISLNFQWNEFSFNTIIIQIRFIYGARDIPKNIEGSDENVQIYQLPKTTLVKIENCILLSSSANDPTHQRNS